MKDYYNILGISDEEKKLSWNDFKKICNKKFRLLSKKWHPDKWVNSSDSEKKIAEEQFKEINEANEILSDEKKKNEYDASLYLNNNMWSNMFNMNPFYNIKNNMKRGQDLKINLFISLKDSYNGINKKIKYKRKIKCKNCNGTGLVSDSEKETCSVCGGSGIKRNTYRQGTIMFTEETMCPNCNGKGFKLKNPCECCNGSGLVNESTEIDITIPKGIYDNMMFSIVGKGNECAENGQDGDLLVFCHINDYNGFIREGDDLYASIKIPFTDALIGKEIEISCIDDKQIKVNIDKLTQPGKLLKINGKGMPNINNNSVYGNLIVKLDYIIPVSLTEEQVKLLKEFDNIEKCKK